MMWTHYCPVDRCWISVGHKEPCNWCGQHAPTEHEGRNQDIVVIERPLKPTK